MEYVVRWIWLKQSFISLPEFGLHAEGGRGLSQTFMFWNDVLVPVCRKDGEREDQRSGKLEQKPPQLPREKMKGT